MDNDIYNIFRNTIANMNKFSPKFIILFWFAGPFIYLIERTPGDVWLSLIALIFLVKSIINKDWFWAKQAWFKFALIYWAWGLLVSIQGPMPVFSFQEGFVWIRFPLYAAAVQCWIAKQREIRFSMLFLLSVSSIIMSFILVTEYYLIGPHDGRLSWPYGDLIPGNFIAKACMPVLLTMLAICISKLKTINIYYYFTIFISIYAVILTGERTHTILIICACLVATLAYKPNFKLTSLIIIIITLIVSLTLYYDQILYTRFSQQLFDNIPVFNTDTSYWGTWRSGLQQGLENFWLGVGPTGSRYTCGHLGPHWLPGTNYCGNHPHNFYIQMFAETGFIGLLIGCTMIFNIIKTCWDSRKELPNCLLANISFIIPFSVFFPFQQAGSFFGQWNNLFMWFAIGLALSNYQKWKKDKIIPS